MKEKNVHTNSMMVPFRETVYKHFLSALRVLGTGDTTGKIEKNPCFLRVHILVVCQNKIGKTIGQ